MSVKGFVPSVVTLTGYTLVQFVVFVPVMPSVLIKASVGSVILSFSSNVTYAP